ncbi:SusC/RagA family TonB-linked outer membrane protein [Chitinophaga tropicalis]|uniref:SusC/RagA family TonB-linked outer membrane protein n=1 Tax=Chitinophaga tropicalis TaxID=2683588 RepID=A0A7K1U4S9_9BACT|nr:TonB-dependent receptor [Chitinophaga tropicalis]MVT09363.1 SusC/RagA family TonB-linked outer membrane protein [Chitinophaga tropicalis]
MKKIRRNVANISTIVVLLFITCITQKTYAQDNEITVQGRVTSDSSALQSVTVVLKSDIRKSTLTNEKGYFSMKVPSNGVLIFSMIGFEKQEVPINGRPSLNVLLATKDNGLNEVTITGFGGTQKKASMVSAITTVNVKELKGPTGNLTNMLAGRIAGMISFQQSGEPGFGTNNSTFYIRGLSTFGTGKQDPLILIDGVESSATDMARVQPDDIADFSVLKDAAASSIYGARGANGVVLINTKTGKEGAAKFSFRAENRLSTNTKNFKMADNITYMNLANEATLTRSPTAIQPYTQNKINHTMAGDDPYLYPNNNWIKQLIRNTTRNQGYNLNISGGSSRARYYIAGTYNLDNGVLKVDPINSFNNNIKLANYSLRTNININVTNSTELIVRMYGQFDDYQGPIPEDNKTGGQTIFDKALRANPVMFPAVYPSSKLPYIEHPLFGSARTVTNGALSSTLYVNPYADMVKGYSVYKTSNIQPQLELKQNLNAITSGLSARAMGYLRRYTYYTVNRSYNPFYYSAIINPATQDYSLSVLNDGSATSVGTVGTEYLGYSEGNKTIDSRLWLEGSLNYNHTFGKLHTVGGTLISYMSSYETGNAGSVTASLPQRNQGLSGRFTYAYDDKYLVELNFGYNGSERFSEKKRYGFFPSAGLGYRISNEPFFEPLKKAVTDLKLRATYGIVGNDQIGKVEDRFFYLSNIDMNNAGYSASFGKNDGVGVYTRNGISISRYANPNITWELSRQINLGMDLRLFNDFDMTVDVYKQYRSQILQPKSYTESAYGLAVVPSSNYGKAETKGIDIAAKYQHSFSRDFWANIRGTFTWAVNKRTVTDEIQYPASLSHLSGKGRSVSQGWGYIAERLFIDQKEVENSPLQFSDAGLLAGDIKYRDVTGDGQINSDDMVPLGLPQQPEIIYGFGASLGYKRLDFSFYFQGSARSTFFIDPRAIQPFYQDKGYQTNLLQVVADSHWSNDNQDLYAFWPRMSTWRVESNLKNSTWWMRSGNFIRLKSVDLGYTFPDFRRMGLKSPRLYFSANNLFTISNFKLWDVEMGGNGLGYPIQSVYNMGAQLNF